MLRVFLVFFAALLLVVQDVQGRHKSKAHASKRQKQKVDQPSDLIALLNLTALHVSNVTLFRESLPKRHLQPTGLHLPDPEYCDLLANSTLQSLSLSLDSNRPLHNSLGLFGPIGGSPALRQRLQQYLKNHTSLTEKPLPDTKWLVWHWRQGGMGNQLRDMVSAFLLALLLDRVFLVSGDVLSILCDALPRWRFQDDVWQQVVGGLLCLCRGSLVCFARGSLVCFALG